jgi:hypothetical protein
MDSFNQPPMYQQQQQSRSMTMPNFNNFTPMEMPVMPTPPSMPVPPSGMNMGMMGQSGARSMTQVHTQTPTLSLQFSILFFP